MIFNILKLFPFSFYCKKKLFGAFYCRMEPMLFQDLFILILLGMSFWISEFKEFDGILRTFKEY